MVAYLILFGLLLRNSDFLKGIVDFAWFAGDLLYYDCGGHFGCVCLRLRLCEVTMNLTIRGQVD